MKQRMEKQHRKPAKTVNSLERLTELTTLNKTD